MRRTNRLTWAILVAIALVGAACTGGDDGGGSTGGGAGSTSGAGAGGPVDLKSVCPDPIVVQKDWQPESEHGFLYNLVGPGYAIDAEKKRVTGPLVSQGRDTGVKIEIRTGGPAVGFQPVPSVMYLDKSIHLGYVATDEAVQFSAKQPTTAVMAQMDISPLAIIWSPQEHPEFNTIGDIGQTNTKVFYTEGLSYMEYLVGSGILRRSQLDGSYDGSPSFFVQSGGKAAIQGFATSEPYLYEHEIRQWGKPMEFQLVNDTGYPVYFASMSIRSGDKDKLAPCLKKLVPILQQSQVDFVKKPDNGIKLILEAVEKYNTGWVYSEGLARYSAQAMVKLDIVGNGPDQTLGNFEMGRVKRIMDITTPIYTAQKKALKPNLKPDDIATNEFIDPKIGLNS